MRRILSVLILCVTSITVAAESQIGDFDSLRVNALFELYQSPDIYDARDILDKQDRIDRCIEEYKTKRPRRSVSVVQDKLYDMIYNFDQVVERLKGRSPGKDRVPDTEKIAALAVIQCETFYSMGVLG